MASDKRGERVVDLSSLGSSFGIQTQQLLESFASFEYVSAKDASFILIGEYPYFNERLSKFVSDYAGIDDDFDEVKKYLRENGKKKHLAFSSANFSQWLSANEKLEYYLAPRTVFKLCLAMGLSINESAQFVYSCLHQNWFNYRDAEELIYCYYLAAQGLYGDETYERALEMVGRVKEAMGEAFVDDSGSAGSGRLNATGYTRLLESGLKKVLSDSMLGPDASEAAFEDYLMTNLPAFTGLIRTARRQYLVFFEEGGIGIRPLRELYSEVEGFELPRTSYLDMRDTRTIESFEKGTDRSRKRLLWGAEYRSGWIDRNGKDCDILNEREIKIEHHAIEKMLEKGVPRGNIIAVLFFQFCYANVARLRSGNPRMPLFERFYDTTNQILDDCGMMPLHPRKMLDSLFLRSLAHSGKTSQNQSTPSPIQYLNDTLQSFYSR